MLSATTQRPWQRIYTTCALVAVTIIILFSVYDLRDSKEASMLLGDKNQITRIATYNATRSTSSPAHILGKDQDVVKFQTDNSHPSTKAATSASDYAISSAASLPNRPRTAFITFLGHDTKSNHASEGYEMNVDNRDAYFVGELPTSSNFSSLAADLDKPPACSAISSCTSLKLDQTHLSHSS